MPIDKKIVNFNPFAKFFDWITNKDDIEKQKSIKENAQGKTAQELDYLDYYSGLGGLDNYVFTDIDFSQLFDTKKDRIAKYREMSLFPEVSDGLDNVCDDAIVTDDNGNIVSLEIDDTDEKIPRAAEIKIRKIFDYLLKNVYKFDETAWNLFRDFIIEGEIYLEKVMDKSKKNIIGLKRLPAFSMSPVYDGNMIKYFRQTLKRQNALSLKFEEQVVNFSANQIIYINYGLFGKSLMDIRGYLESSIRPYNQLRSLEDSLMVYRLVRAPQRKVWNIDVGRMPKGKAKEFLKQMVERYKKKTIYDPDTGKTNSAQNVQSMSEDYWFAKSEDGKGTTVDVLGGDMNLGELNDLKYFLEKLYKSLKLPKSRWDTEKDYSFSGGKMGEITREEVKFSNFVSRLQNIFMYVLLDPFMDLLRLRGVDEKYLDPSLYIIKFSKNNLFTEYRDMDMLESRFRILQDASNYIITPENANSTGIFAKEYVVKEIFKFDDEQYEKNQEMVEEELEKLKEKQAEEGMGSFGQEGVMAGNIEGEGDSELAQIQQDLEKPLPGDEEGETEEENVKKKGKKYYKESKSYNDRNLLNEQKNFIKYLNNYK